MVLFFLYLIKFGLIRHCSLLFLPLFTPSFLSLFRLTEFSNTVYNDENQKQNKTVSTVYKSFLQLCQCLRTSITGSLSSFIIKVLLNVVCRSKRVSTQSSNVFRKVFVYVKTVLRTRKLDKRILVLQYNQGDLPLEVLQSSRQVRPQNK